MLDQLVFRWGGNRERHGTGITAVAYSCGRERAEALRAELAPLLHVEGWRAPDEYSLVRHILRETGDVVLIHRRPHLDAPGRTSTLAHALVGSPNILMSRATLALATPTWEWTGPEQAVAPPHELRPLPGSRLRLAAKSGWPGFVNEVAHVREPLVVVTAQLLRTPSHRITVRIPDTWAAEQGLPSARFAPLLVWGLCGVFGDWLGRDFWSFATFDTSDTNGLRVVCVPEWRHSAVGDAGLERIDPGNAMQDEAQRIATDLVALFLWDPTNPGYLRALLAEYPEGRLLPLGERLELLRLALKRHRLGPRYHSSLTQSGNGTGNAPGDAADVTTARQQNAPGYTARSADPRPAVPADPVSPTTGAQFGDPAPDPLPDREPDPDAGPDNGEGNHRRTAPVPAPPYPPPSPVQSSPQRDEPPQPSFPPRVPAIGNPTGSVLPSHPSGLPEPFAAARPAQYEETYRTPDRQAGPPEPELWTEEPPQRVTGVRRLGKWFDRSWWRQRRSPDDPRSVLDRARAAADTSSGQALGDVRRALGRLPDETLIGALLKMNVPWRYADLLLGALADRTRWRTVTQADDVCRNVLTEKLYLGHHQPADAARTARTSAWLFQWAVRPYTHHRDTAPLLHNVLEVRRTTSGGIGGRFVDRALLNPPDEVLPDLPVWFWRELFDVAPELYTWPGQEPEEDRPPWPVARAARPRPQAAHGLHLAAPPDDRRKLVLIVVSVIAVIEFVLLWVT